MTGTRRLIPLIYSPTKATLHKMKSFRDAVIALVATTDAQLTWRQTAALLIVHWEPDAKIGVRELAGMLHISKPAVTRSIDRLEELDLAARVQSRDDARRIELRLLKAGKALAGRMEAMWPRPSRLQKPAVEDLPTT